MFCLKQTGIVVVASKVCNFLHPNQTNRHFERAAEAQISCLQNLASTQLQETAQQKNILFSQIEELRVTSQQEIESEYQASYNELIEEFAKSKKIHEESLTALSLFWLFDTLEK